MPLVIHLINHFLLRKRNWMSDLSHIHLLCYQTLCRLFISSLIFTITKKKPIGKSRATLRILSDTFNFQSFGRDCTVDDMRKHYHQLYANHCLHYNITPTLQLVYRFLQKACATSNFLWRSKKWFLVLVSICRISQCFSRLEWVVAQCPLLRLDKLIAALMIPVTI